MANNKKNTSGKSVQQSLTFTMELYPEWSYFTNILSHITNFKYAYILHDKDKFEDGSLKKPHCHVVVKYGGYRTLTSVQNEFKKYQLEARFVQTCNKRAMLRYLVHKDDPDKHQYQINEIKTNMMDEVELALKDIISSDAAFYHINKYIDESNEYISQSQLNKYCIENGYLRGLKAYNAQINNSRYEHNKTIMTIDENNEISRLHQKLIIDEHKKQSELFDTALVSGFDEIEFEGQRYQIVKVPNK